MKKPKDGTPAAQTQRYSRLISVSPPRTLQVVPARRARGRVLERIVYLWTPPTAPNSRCSTQGDGTPGDGLLVVAAGLDEGGRSTVDPGGRDSEEGGRTQGLEGGGRRTSVTGEGLEQAPRGRDVDDHPEGGAESAGGGAQEEKQEAESGSTDVEKRDTTLTLDSGGNQLAEARGAPREGDCGSGQETRSVASTTDLGKEDGDGDRQASVVSTSDVVLASLPPAADSPIGDNAGERGGVGASAQIEGADVVPAPETARKAGERG